MAVSRRWKRKIPFFIVLFIFLCAGVVFLLRSPVLIVTDISFSQIYGTTRLQLKLYETTLKLFRRVIPVLVNEGAGPDLIALAAEAASKSPRAVFFSYRHLEGARFYKENNAEITVFVMAGRNPKPKEETELIFVHTDTAQDLYKAGLFAALLAVDNNVLLLNDNNLTVEQSRAFREGLVVQGFLGISNLINATEEYYNYSDLGCVVVQGPAVKFLEENRQIPIILFSWLDPALLPQTVKLVFDDSPWALAVKTLKSTPQPGEDMLIPSELVILLNKTEKKNFRNINAILKEKIEKS